MAVALLALFVALGAGAYAVQVAPKNSVTSKSIKDGQVKARDLGTGTTIMSARPLDLPTSPNGGATRNPVGLSGQLDPVVALAPVDLTVANLRVSGTTMGIGQARAVEIHVAPANPPDTKVVGCTVESGKGTCRSKGRGKIDAGEDYLIFIQNGPGGAAGESASVAYTLKPR